MAKIKEILNFYLEHLYMSDYLFFALLILLFLLLLLFVLLLRNRAFLAFSMLFLAFVLPSVLGYFGYQFLDEKIRARSIEVVSFKNLQNSNKFVIDFDITNHSQYNFKFCKIRAQIYQKENKDDNFITRYKLHFIPIKVKSLTLQSLKKDESQSQRISFDNFQNNDTYDIKLNSKCF